MTQISTVAELEALPAKSVVIDDDGDAWQKAEDGSGDDGRWHGALPDGATYSASILLTWKPFTVLHRPDAGQTRVMVRCVADGCMDAHALPAGAFYLCPQHRGHITLGRD